MPSVCSLPSVCLSLPFCCSLVARSHQYNTVCSIYCVLLILLFFCGSVFGKYRCRIPADVVSSKYCTSRFSSIVVQFSPAMYRIIAWWRIARGTVSVRNLNSNLTLWLARSLRKEEKKHSQIKHWHAAQAQPGGSRACGVGEKIASNFFFCFCTASGSVGNTGFDETTCTTTMIVILCVVHCCTIILLLLLHTRNIGVLHTSIVCIWMPVVPVCDIVVERTASCL